VGALSVGLAVITLCACSDTPDKKGVGDSAADIVKPQPYSRLLIEVDRIETVTPIRDSLYYLVDELSRLLQKPAGVELATTTGTIPSQGEGRAWSLSEIKGLEATHRDHFSGGDTVALYFLIVDGHSISDTEDAVKLATAYSSTSVVVYSKTLDKVIADALDTVTNPQISKHLMAAMYSSTLVHEVGHLMGLVGIEIPMVEDHVDPNAPGHDADVTCVMSALNETRAIAAYVTESLNKNQEHLTLFCNHCLNDIRSFQTSH
jgi:hypothetical protein